MWGLQLEEGQVRSRGRGRWGLVSVGIALCMRKGKCRKATTNVSISTAANARSTTYITKLVGSGFEGTRALLEVQAGLTDRTQAYFRATRLGLGLR